ncbi:AraC family transcriptional regulator [Scatolibacter rhodanostii]|uniref:AraC family transcriptional regulator n=1 Tax=Scatolibacter rhodanostii TaxID=2014781 RepID=UPI00117EEFEB|nr:AraC family transcriptional regulator [Scatolibacter rhodanostii]
MQFDYEYLCHGLGHLTGLETRVYQKGERVQHYSPYEFNPDMARLISHKLENHEDNAFYIETDDLLVFGVIKSRFDQKTIVIGPTSQIRPGKQETVAILYMLDEPYSRLPELQNYFSNMIAYPFEMFLEILCFVNYAINDEKLSVANLIKQSDQLLSNQSDEWEEGRAESITDAHNTFQSEQLMLSYITTGNVDAVLAFFNSPPTGRIGSIAHNELRQRKNALICAATLMSRAAIAGGMPSDTAFAISDRYIQKAELLKTGGDITKLNMEMMLDYTQRVEALKCGAEDSNIAKNVIRYIQKNISKKITVKEIAENLNLNRSYLSERFKLDTGTAIGDFIMQTKVEESKRMLKISNLTIADISDYLSFSSQSYFQTVFKKAEGCTPKEYRIKVQTE